MQFMDNGTSFFIPPLFQEPPLDQPSVHFDIPSIQTKLRSQERMAEIGSRQREERQVEAINRLDKRLSEPT